MPISNFFLSYQGIPSNDIFSIKSQLMRKLCPELNFSIDTNFKNEKINYYSEHSSSSINLKIKFAFYKSEF